MQMVMIHSSLIVHFFDSLRQLNDNYFMKQNDFKKFNIKDSSSKQFVSIEETARQIRFELQSSQIILKADVSIFIFYNKPTSLMKLLSVILVMFLSVSALTNELNLPVRVETQQKLNFSLQRLVKELEYFRSPFENRTSLYKRVAQTEQYLQQVTSQVGEYVNIIRGRSNVIGGRNNIIVGSFNTLRGSNNYVFIQKYVGQANGDLLIGRWRIEIDKKTLILINSGFAISFINEETNRKYLKYLTENRKLSSGSILGEGTVTVIKQDKGEMSEGFSIGASVQNGKGQIENSGTMVWRDTIKESSLPVKTEVFPLSAASDPLSPTAIVLPIRQTFLYPTSQKPQTKLQNSPISTNIPIITSISSSSNNIRASIEQAIAARAFPLSITQRQATNSQQAGQMFSNGQARQAIEMFNSNQLQLAQMPSNLRTEPQAQKTQTQTISQPQRNNQSQTLTPPLDQRISLGAKIITFQSQNQFTSSLPSTPQRIVSSANTPKQPPIQSALINLAFWRNRP